MKIKQKKQMNLPQLIEWAMLPDTDISCEKYETDSIVVTFSELGNPHIESKWHYLLVDETFTVEVEETVTEDTRFEHLVLIDDRNNSASYENKCIGDVHDYNSEEFHAYINGEFKCIWRDGKLVE